MKITRVDHRLIRVPFTEDILWGSGRRIGTTRLICRNQDFAITIACRRHVRAAQRRVEFTAGEQHGVANGFGIQAADRESRQ